jgi:hypothetical protein
LDYFIILYENKLNKKLKKYRILLTGFILGVFGLVGLSFMNESFFSVFIEFFLRFSNPAGVERVGLTVSENIQPFFSNWIFQFGASFFWMFYLSIILFGFFLTQGVKEVKDKMAFFISFILMFSGLFFSRISPYSFLNGTNLISNFFLFFGLFIFISFFIYLIINEKIKINCGEIILFSWIFFMVIGCRGALRFFFIITPLVCFMVGYLFMFIIKLYNKQKEEVVKFALVLVFFTSLVFLLINMQGFIKADYYQAEQTGPSANVQWQNAMQWVRDNTQEDSIFVHWWDYGYWVQYLGERATITDGGHAVGIWDHLIGRYVLTTKNPLTALSFIKSHNVSYLLIDQTDIGKYPAYSKIGSDKNQEDRYSQISVLVLDESQIKETSNETIMFYPCGGIPVDEDIIYNLKGKEILIPSGNSALFGIILTLPTSEKDKIKLEGVFYYKEKNYVIPIRYFYLNGQYFDLQFGINSMIRFVPKFNPDNPNPLNDFGAAIYLSEKTKDSLFSQLYLMNNSYGLYNYFNLVHTEDCNLVKYLKDFIDYKDDLIYYSGIQGPIKIWKVKPNENILINQEFLSKKVVYGAYDNLEFIK